MSGWCWFQMVLIPPASACIVGAAVLSSIGGDRCRCFRLPARLPVRPSAESGCRLFPSLSLPGLSCGLRLTDLSGSSCSTGDPRTERTPCGRGVSDSTRTPVVTQPKRPLAPYARKKNEASTRTHLSPARNHARLRALSAISGFAWSPLRPSA